MPQQVLNGTVRVVIHASTPHVRAGLATFVALDPRLDELPRDRIREADVIVVVLDVADTSALDLLPRLCDEPGARFLVVVGRQWRADAAAARRRGVRAVVWWDFCSPDVFTRSVLAAAGRADRADRVGRTARTGRPGLTGHSGRPGLGGRTVRETGAPPVRLAGDSGNARDAGDAGDTDGRSVAARPRTAPAPTPAPELTSREVDVLRLIAEGKQVDEIAAALSYSERTVRYILHGAMKRTRTRNRAHAVSYAIRAGLI
ncbi:helix-turn-helix transcriptional regulator [Streptomyces apricus]|uniref:helix-turn-helix transcriptional regulator n=1 Tax=Streptomyces apricus TaxID=1828112 RepID=UPI002E2763A4